MFLEIKSAAGVAMHVAQVKGQLAAAPPEWHEIGSAVSKRIENPIICDQEILLFHTKFLY